MTVIKAVMYGAGNIGRGFIGALLSQIGYEVVFIDANVSIVNLINEKKKYVQEIVGDKPEEILITGVRAVNGTDRAAVAAEIADADILATALGAAVLPKVVPIIADGLEQRWQNNPDNKLDLLICENLMNADRYLNDLLKKELNAPYDTLMDANLGLVETSIGRMVPVMNDETREKDPLRICVEAYDYLPVDRSAVKGDLPNYPKLLPYQPFGFYLERKLYLHNMGHAETAYLGQLAGYEKIGDAVSDPSIRFFVENAMIESALAISRKYNISFDLLKPHIDDLIYRFGNRELGDTTERVGRDPIRKLKPEDRLVGAARNAEQQGFKPVYLSLAIASALNQLSREKNVKPENLLREICEIDPEEMLGIRTLLFLNELQKKEIDWGEITELAGKLGYKDRGMIP